MCVFYKIWGGKVLTQQILLELQDIKSFLLPTYFTSPVFWNRKLADELRFHSFNLGPVSAQSQEDPALTPLFPLINNHCCYHGYTVEILGWQFLVNTVLTHQANYLTLAYTVNMTSPRPPVWLRANLPVFLSD